MATGTWLWRCAGLTALALGAVVSGVALAEEPYHGENHRSEHGAEQQDFIHGAPQEPSRAWTLAAGGRIYDKWWDALDRDEPEGTNPAYPASALQDGASTWRCKECHGWDYLGAEGIYSKGSHFTGIKGVLDAQGQPIDALMATLRDQNHPYTREMITDAEMERVALFISEGLVDMRTFIDIDTRKVKAGDVDRGREIFQTTCAACHGFDGRAMDWGDGDAHNFVGTEAAALPDEVFSKISNAHTGVAMINLHAFSVEDRIAVLAYTATLPQGIDD